MKESTKTALAVVFLVVVAGAFWMLLLSPKRDKAGELAEQKTALSAEVATEQQRADEALAAKARFSADYAQLLQLGTAVPPEASTSSLLVQLDGLSDDSDTEFQAIALGGGSGGGAPAATSEGGESTESVNPTSLPPLGGSIGAAGLYAMPYSVQFEGGFFDIANFVHRLDSLVKTKQGYVDAKGRLVTIDSFTLMPAGNEENAGSDSLNAQFNVTTYVTPPGQGITAGATPAGPAETTPDLP
jgi:Tfp pilus assembly protein PilO